MTSSRPASARRFGAARILSLLVLFGCAAETTTAPPVQGPNFAASGGSGPTVRSADPDSGLQNTTIDVRVLGSGFDNGSKATWALAGDTANATTKITTNSTRFVKSGELVANITIAADAPLALFDIVVVTSNGKKGIGIEKFEVKVSNNGGPVSASFDDTSPYALQSDGGTYVDAQSCVLGAWFADGLVQLRTIAPTTACLGVARPGWRFFRFNFGVPVVDLDQDGVAEAIEDAPGRILADDVFAQGATSTPVRILILLVNPDGTTKVDTKWTVHFPAGVTVSDGGGGARILEAVSGAAAANIYAGYVDVPIRKNKTPVATVQLPFRLTVTPLP
jgi:hypothetical protein